MEPNTNLKGGFWMLVEELGTEPAETNDGRATEKNEILDDEFFPDTSF